MQIFALQLTISVLPNTAGGGPDTWCNSSNDGVKAHCAPKGPTNGCAKCNASSAASEAEASRGGSCKVSAGLCFGSQGQNLKTIADSTPDKCCAACAKNPACNAWTLTQPPSKPASADICYLKTKASLQDKRTHKCGGTSGLYDGPPRPPAPSPPGEPLTWCPGGWCLYDVAADPYEQAECSAANADVVAAMKQEMGVVLETYTQYEIDKSCPAHKFSNESHVGKYWGPWCGID